jgi:hypothetical protein
MHPVYTFTPRPLPAHLRRAHSTNLKSPTAEAIPVSKPGSPLLQAVAIVLVTLTAMVAVWATQ